MHFNHNRYPGGLKERSAEQQLEKDPTEVLRKAVYGMLPKNKLRDVCTLPSFLLLSVIACTVRPACLMTAINARLCSGAAMISR